MKMAKQLIAKVKLEGEDFEFYPTSYRMLDIIYADIKKTFGNLSKPSLLDCGAGDGRALLALTEGDKFAIEKSRPLLEAMSKEIFVVGTDFDQQTLLDKKVDMIFSNPPYLSFVQWICKIIQEANAKIFYAIIPERWESNELIKNELSQRAASYEILAKDSFHDAERQARCSVHIVRFNFTNVCADETRRYVSQVSQTVDPFTLWFDNNFKSKTEIPPLAETESKIKEQAKDKLERSKKEVAPGKSLIETLTTCYDRDMSELMETYISLSKMPTELLSELDIKFEDVKARLKLKINSLKDAYWRELINRLSTITNKLTFDTRRKLLDKLFSSTNVDFTSDNAHSIVIWISKNANCYFDSQLIEFVEKLTEKANVQNYKSNKRTFGEECWRYSDNVKKVDHYKLDYRIVLENVGGLSNKLPHTQTKHGLSPCATKLLDDLCVVALNLGFDTENMMRSEDFDWSKKGIKRFLYTDHKTGKPTVLFEARAFIKGNLHVKIKPELMCKLNVEFGRLKGWLKSKEQACDELDITPEEAKFSFGSNFKITSDSSVKLLKKNITITQRGN